MAAMSTGNIRASATASYEGFPPEKTNQASALVNVARSLGGSMGVALAQTILAQRQQFHQSRLIEHIAPSRSRSV